MYTWDILHDRVEKDGISLSMWRSSGFVSFWASSTGSTKENCIALRKNIIDGRPDIPVRIRFEKYRTICTCPVCGQEMAQEWDGRENQFAWHTCPDGHAQIFAVAKSEEN